MTRKNRNNNEWEINSSKSLIHITFIYHKTVLKYLRIQNDLFWETNKYNLIYHLLLETIYDLTISSWFLLWRTLKRIWFRKENCSVVDTCESVSEFRNSIGIQIRCTSTRSVPRVTTRNAFSNIVCFCRKEFNFTVVFAHVTFH